MLRSHMYIFAGLGLCLASSCAGCLERTFAPDRVAQGVARLSIRNAAYLSKVVLADTKCGFSNPAVRRAALVQGQPGEQGAVTSAVKKCTIALPQQVTLSTDCLGAKALAQGSVTVSGTQRIRGTITGNPETPIIPAGADAVHLELDADFDNFTIEKSDSHSSMTNLSGHLHFAVEPRIALSKSLGVCAVSTLDYSFSNVTLTDAKVNVNDEGSRFPVDVPSLHLTAQVGKWQSEENTLTGDVTVWDSVQKIPIHGETGGLDEKYTAKSYLDSISCDPDLVVPVTYSCPSLKTQLVHGASRLSIKTLGALASMIESDTRCGFSSPQVMNNGRIMGATGGPGSATFTLPAPCVISYSTKTALSKDCNDHQQFAVGTVSITGTKTLTGRLTGDVRQPVAPVTRDPAEFKLSASFDGFVLSNSVDDQRFAASSGRLDGTVRPRVALDSRSDICSNTTSIAEFNGVEWHDAKLLVSSSGFDFGVNISQAQLTAQSGTKGQRTNYLQGSVVSDGIPVAVPPAGSEPLLDPAYDEAAFVSSFSCAPGFQMPPSDAACSLDKAMGTNIARLVVQSAGTIASLVQADSTCGFSAMSVMTSPSQVVGDNGEMGSLKWNISGCQVGAPSGIATLSTDCDGTKSYVSGTANVAAERFVTGERQSSYIFFKSIIPRSRDAMTITLSSVPLSEFAAYTVLANDVSPYAKLTIHSGTLSATVKPALGERKSKPGVFDIGTPVASLSGVKLTQASVTLEVDGKRFALGIASIEVSALNGTLGGASNRLQGSVTFTNGQTVTIAPPTPLNPEFSQSRFDASYSCTADLMSTIPL